MRNLTILCALLGLAGCAMQAPRESGPALWVLKSPSATVYLFGTVHILPVPVAWQTRTIQHAFADSSELWVETDLDNSKSIAAAMRARGVSATYDLQAALGPDGWSKFTARMSPCGMQADKARHFRPWLAGLMLQYCINKTSAHGPAGAINAAATPDRFLVEQAKTENKMLRYLEPVDGQIALLFRRPDTEQAAVLLKLLNAPNPGKPDPDTVRKFLTSLTAMELAWAHGDQGTLTALVASAPAQLDPGGYKAIFTDRNQAFAARIADILHRPTTSFVAMGAGHLIGQGSVLEDLAAHGFIASRME
jgi:uncharacterized protein YbaP (TraB family)